MFSPPAFSLLRVPARTIHAPLELCHKIAGVAGSFVGIFFEVAHDEIFEIRRKLASHSSGWSLRSCLKLVTADFNEVVTLEESLASQEVIANAADRVEIRSTIDLVRCANGFW